MARSLQWEAVPRPLAPSGKSEYLNYLQFPMSKKYQSERARRKSVLAALIGVLTMGIAACSPSDSVESEATPSRVERKMAIARLNPTQGNEATGTVTFVQEAAGVRVIADLREIGSGLHGFHIHEKGDCSAPDASSAGGHFNPTGAPHGGPEAEKRHVGDLGNLEATEAGGAMMERVFETLSLEGENSILGKSVVVHAERDDFSSQPSGAAGARIACGVIELSE